MIRKSDSPVAFSTLFYDLDDAKDHLIELIDAITNNSEYTEDEYRVELGHIYAHLNRAWNNRNLEDDSQEPDHDESRRYPQDLDPIA